MAAAIPEYPEESPQGCLGGPWWIEVGGQDLQRGRLVRAFIPHVDQEPRQLTLVGRTEATEHGSARYAIEPLRIGGPRSAPRLPVAAMPTYEGEVHAVYRAKVRPALVLSAPTPEVPKALRTGAAGWQTSPTLLVAPYYGVDPGGRRGGWREEFVDRIRRGEYPQYLWDKLPLGGAQESILRLDHVQPVGRHANACAPTAYCLSDDALDVLDEWFEWLWTGLVRTDGVLAMIRGHLLGPSVG